MNVGPSQRLRRRILYHPLQNRAAAVAECQAAITSYVYDRLSFLPGAAHSSWGVPSIACDRVTIVGTERGEHGASGTIGATAARYGCINNSSAGGLLLMGASFLADPPGFRPLLIPGSNRA
jgi:hypothetical protein